MLKIPENISLAIDCLTQNGYKAYIVGGCVRDSLLGITPSDFDITTSAKPEEIMSLFERTIPTGIAHGTVTVVLDNEPIEITTFRTEGKYNDNRHPENVEFVTDLREDLSRRDFTVNALAFSEKTGLVDLFGGLEDLEKKILKAVGNPRKRFKEDALRILRLFRFSSQLEFSIDENTLNAALELKRGLENISRERIFAELKKAICGKNPKATLPLINSGALAFLGIEKSPDFYEKTQDPDLRLFAFLKDTTDPVKVLKEFKASNREIDKLNKLLKLSTLKINTKEEIKNALFLTDEASVRSYFEYADQDTHLLNEIIENQEPYLISHLDISGNDLKALGFENKEIGKCLERLRQTVVKTPEKNKKETLILLTK